LPPLQGDVHHCQAEGHGAYPGAEGLWASHGLVSVGALTQDAAAIYRQTGDRHGEGTTLSNLGRVLQEVGRFGEAITAH